MTSLTSGATIVVALLSRYTVFCLMSIAAYYITKTERRLSRIKNERTRRDVPGGASASFRPVDYSPQTMVVVEPTIPRMFFTL